MGMGSSVQPQFGVYSLLHGRLFLRRIMDDKYIVVPVLPPSLFTWAFAACTKVRDTCITLQR
jgi:hypothetical protein